MSEPDLPRREFQHEDGNGDEEHPLKEGIEAAKDGDTASLEEILALLD